MTQARDWNAVENRVKSIDPTRAAACSHFVILLIDEETGDADAFGPLDEDAASREADTLRAHLNCSEELAEVRLMVVPLVEVDLRR